MERATSEHSVISRPDSGPPAYLLWSPPCPPTAPAPHSCPTTLIFWMSLALSYFFFYCPPSPPLPPSPLPTCPASTAPSHSVSTLYLLPTQCSSSPGLQRGREKNVFCFYFLVVIVFLHKMNKVNIFYYTEQKKVFFFTWLKIRGENCNKEKLLYIVFFFIMFLWICLHRLELVDWSRASDPVRLENASITFVPGKTGSNEIHTYLSCCDGLNIYLHSICPSY